MPPNFSKIFHLVSKDHSLGHPPATQDDREWPEEWKTTYYKSYARLPKIKLPESEPIAEDLFEAIRTRSSQRDYSHSPLTLGELSLLLKYSCGNIGTLYGGRGRRAQPSGGGRFPIEVYPIVFRGSDGLAAGVYHYNVQAHALDILLERSFSRDDISHLFLYPFVKDAGLALVTTSVFWRNQNKYGERGYRYILLEAGHIGQNLYLVSNALHLKICAMGTYDKNVENILDIDGIHESVVYALVLGK